MDLVCAGSRAAVEVYSSDAHPLQPQGGRVRTHRYRITVAGALGGTSREIFEDFAIETNGATTTLFGDLDSSGLHGALNRVQMLRLELLQLVRMPDGLA
jgi:hypothetical protein